MASAKVQGRFPFDTVQINDLVWLPDGRGLVVTYQNNPTPFARVQIGLLSATGKPVSHRHQGHE